MISNQILQSNIDGLKEITRIDLCVCDIEGKVLASTFENAEEYESSILAFVDSKLGQRMKTAAEQNALYREQPFVIAQKMNQIEAAWNGEETVLVQGIIDAYFIEDDEIVLVDYKTDKVSPGGEQDLIDLYHIQLEDYAAALERMLQKKVKETYIYSFTLRKMIPLS